MSKLFCLEDIEYTGVTVTCNSIISIITISILSVFECWTAEVVNMVWSSIPSSNCDSVWASRCEVEGWSAALCRLWSHFHPLRENSLIQAVVAKRGLRADVSSISHRKPHFVHFNFLRLDNSQERLLDHAGLAWVLSWWCFLSGMKRAGKWFYREKIYIYIYLLPFSRTLQYIVHKQKVTHDAAHDGK